MRLPFFIAVLMVFITTGICAQQNTVRGKITVKITDERQAALQGVTVSLLSGKDSSIAKITITEQDGNAYFEEVKAGNFFLQVTHASFKKYTSAPVTIDEKNTVINLPAITLTAEAGELKGVTVQAQKPFIEKLVDKMVVNVEGSIVSAGSSAMEVLERSPGVVVDRNDNISLKGKQGVIIFINGKPSGIAGSDLGNYLRAIPSSTISKIEIITNPSAKYDAAGNAGIINIILKKDQRMGTNGTVTVNYGQGFYPKAGAGITFNHREKNINIFGSYNYAYRENYNHLDLYRKFLSDGKVQGAYNQNNYLDFIFRTHVYRVGMDYTISKNTTVGMVVNGIANRFSNHGNNYTLVLDGQEKQQSYNNNYGTIRDTLKNIAANVNLKHTFDTTGKELTVDVDYATYHNTDGQRFLTNFFNLDGSVAAPDDILTGFVKGKLDIESFKADYVNPLKRNAKFETGVKSSIVTADNDIQYFNASSGTPVYDPNQSNHFIYKENINAAYINFSKEFKKVTLQLGVRAEQTNVKGNQVTTGQKFDTSYLKLFPSAFVNYTASENNTFSVSVSRRLDRPNYKQLNPFRFYINNSTYTEGNPYLQPQFTYSFEVSHTYKNIITTTLSYSITKNEMINVLIPSPTEDKITIETDRNLAQYKYYGAAVSATVKIARWWNSINNGNAYYGIYTGNLANTSIQNGNVTFNINSDNSFTLGHGYTAELTGFYQYREIYAYMDVKPYGLLSAGIQKNILKNKGTIKLNMADVFHAATKATNAYRDYVETFAVWRDTRVLNIAFTYRFGNNKVAAARRMSGGAEDEKKRAN